MDAPQRRYQAVDSLQPYAPEPSPRMAPEADPSSESWDLKDVLAVFWKYRHLMLAVVFGSILVGVLLALLQTPVYEASTRVLVQSAPSGGAARTGNGLDAISEMLEAGRARSIATQVQVLQSRPLLKDALASLRYPPESRLPHRVTAKSAEDTDIIDVTVAAATPQFASKLANAIADVYIQQSKHSNRASTAATKRFLTEQVEAKRRELDAAENQLKLYKQQTGIVSIPERIASATSQLNSINSELASSETQAASLGAQLKAVRSLLSRPEQSIVTGTSLAMSPLVSKLEGDLAQLELERAAALKEWQPDTPEVKALDDRIEQTRAALQKEMRRGLVTGGKTVALNPTRLALVQQAADLSAQQSAVQARVRALRSAAAVQRQVVAQLPAKEREFATLTRRAQELERFYTDLSNQLQAVSIMEQAQTASARVLEAAEPPLFPTEPNLPRNLALSTALGLIFATMLALLISYLDDTVKTPEEAERLLGLPTLGVVPALRSRGPILLGPEDPGIAAESFRLMQGNLRLVARSAPVRSIVVTSVDPGEGKTTTAVNLAIALAAAGHSVILVDVDMRAPAVSRSFHLEEGVGLTDVVLDNRPLSQALQPTPYPNLRVLLSGSRPRNAVEFLHSSECRAVLEKVEAQADFVVYDAPPAGLLPDGLLLAAEADGVIVVARWGKTRRADLRRLVERLAGVRGKLLGICVNGTHAGDRTYQRYYHYYRAYSKDHAHPSAERNGASSPAPLEPVSAGAGRTRERDPDPVDSMFIQQPDEPDQI